MALTTELDAVNIILSSVGQAPVNKLDASRADVRIAQGLLKEVSRTIQSEGWNFNTEFDVVLTKDVDGIVNVPSNLIRFDLEDSRISSISNSPRPVIRGTTFYDVQNRTDVFTADLKGTAVYFLEFDQLVEAAVRYMTIKAARLYQQRFIGDNALERFTAQEEVIARTQFLRHELDTGNYTFLDHNAGSVSARFRRYRR